MTRGYFEFPGPLHNNDGAVLLVAPGAPRTITPEPIGVTTYNTRPIPSLLLRGMGYPCGSGAQAPPTTAIICFLRPLEQLSEQLRALCVGALVANPEFCNFGEPTVVSDCCTCEAVPISNRNSVCASLTQGCSTLHQWVAAQEPLPVSLSLPTGQGKLLAYIGPTCPGAWGGPLINANSNSIFGVLIEGSSECTSSFGGKSNLGIAFYAQFVDRGQKAGVWVGALASALRGRPPNG